MAHGRFAFETRQSVAVPVRDVFAYLADVRNLNGLTPRWMRFHIFTPTPIELDVGTRVEYRLVLRGVAVPWVSEIVLWEPHVRFAYEQRRGPYRAWRHEHEFAEAEGRTLCVDRVTYDVAGGAAVRWLCVEPHLRSIFRHRNRILVERFGTVARPFDPPGGAPRDGAERKPPGCGGP